MIKKTLRLILLSSIFLYICACSTETPPEASEEPVQPLETAVPVTLEPGPEPTVEPFAETEPPEPTVEDEDETADWQGVYSAFLSDNYETLLDIGFAGVGFIDLDLDGTPELLIFDAGASASMGAQFFDIVNGTVECVSANLSAIGENFGGSGFTQVYVNANQFSDFRLAQDTAASGLFFYVVSGNGALDFSYSEIIRFGFGGSYLTLESLLYMYEDYDTETGEPVFQSFKKSGADISAEDYTSAYDAFFATAHDTGYNAVGAFIWENANYSDGYDGFMAMVDFAIKNYTPAV